MANDGTDRNTSQFFFIMSSEPSTMEKYYDTHTCFGEVTKGLDFLEKLVLNATKDEEGKEKIPFVKTH